MATELFPGQFVQQTDADPAPDTDFTVWDAETGGTDITSLLTAADGLTPYVATTDAEGNILPFRGPDGFDGPAFVDTGASIRYMLVSSTVWQRWGATINSLGAQVDQASADAAAAAISAASAAAAAALAEAANNDNGAVGVAPADPIRFMAGTPAQWAAATYVLPYAMPGVAIDLVAHTVTLKVGDGLQLWPALPTIAGGGGGTITASSITDSTAVGRSIITAANGPAVKTLIGVDKIIWGTGSPEGVVTATVGTLFARTDGTTDGTFYVKETGSGNTGWKAKGGVVTAASLGLTPYAGVTPQQLPISDAVTAQYLTATHTFLYDGTAWPAVPAAVPAGRAHFDSEGYPAAPPPAQGPRPAALPRDKWFPDHTVV